MEENILFCAVLFKKKKKQNFDDAGKHGNVE